MADNKTFTNALWIELQVAEQNVREVVIQSQRLRLPQQLFANKPVSVATNLVGLLFTLCGTAQTIAAQCATQQACSQSVTSSLYIRYQHQVAIEALFEHLLRLTQDWPKILSIPALAADQLQILFRHKRLLQNGFNTDSYAALSQWLEHYYLGLSVDNWLSAVIQGDFHLLQQHGVLGKLLIVIQQRQWLDLGNCNCAFLPNLTAAQWHELLTTADVEQFLAQPQLHGLAHETSSLSRQWENSRLKWWREEYGYGLPTRLIARVLDLLTYLKQLTTSKPFINQDLIQPGIGLATIETARGLLVHRVQQADGLIQHYQILAPTEWNFHPQGSLYRMLTTLTFETKHELRAKAHALITALDPCVPYQLEIKPYA